MFKKITRSTLTALGLIPLALFSEEIRAEQSSEVFRSSRLVAEAVVGKHNVGGNLDLLVPFYGDNTRIWYGNLQGFQYGSMYRTYSIGGGHRQVVDNAIYGIYGFFDRQTSVNKINYNRYTAGLERLGETWDFRTNFYLYANSPDATNLVDQGRKSAFIRGSNILYAHLYEVEKVYNGADFEVGRTLGLDNLRGYLGYYNFGDVIKGPKARLEYQVNPRVALSASTQTDVRGWLTYAGISYWFGKTTIPGATGIESRMLDPVVRDMTVAANMIDSYVEYDVDARNIYFAQPGGVSSDATPTAAPLGDETTTYSLQEALALSKDNDIIYLVGGPVPFDISNGITLKPGQMLWSSAQDLSLNGFLVKPGNASQAVTLIKGGITVSNGATLNGFSLDGSTIEHTQNGITINGTSRVDISKVRITGFDRDSDSAGINVSGAAPVNLTDVTSDHNGIGLTASAGVINVDGSNNSFQNNLHGSGILIEDSAQLQTLNNTKTSYNAWDGISVNGTGTYTASFSNVTSDHNGKNGLIVDNSNITLTTNTLNTNYNDNGGVNVSAGRVAIRSTANNFSHNTGAGVYVQNSGQLAYLENATITDNTGNGIAFVGDATFTSTMNKVTSTSNGLNGFKLANANATVNSTTSLVVDGNIETNLAISAGSMSIAGSDNSFSNSVGGSGIEVSATGKLISLSNATISSNQDGDGLDLGGTATYTSTLSGITSNLNSQNGYEVSNANVTVAASSLTGESNTETGLTILAGTVAINDDGTQNSFSSNGSWGLWVTDLGKLTALHNAAVSSNTYDGIHIEGTATYDASFSKITANTNGGNGISVGGQNINLTATSLTADYNTFNGLVVGSGTVALHDDGTQSSFSHNQGSGVSIITVSEALPASTAALTALNNVIASENAQYGILLGGDSTYEATFTNVTSNENALDGIYVVNPNVTVTINNIISNGNLGGSGLWIEKGTVQDASSTKNEFKSNSKYGVLVGTSSSTASGGRLLSLLNADTSHNGSATTAFDGILLNSNNTTDPVTLTNITSTYNGGNGIWILQPGTVTINNSDFSHNYNVSTGITGTQAGIRVDNIANLLTVNLNDVSSNNNAKTGMHVRYGTVNVNGTSDKNTYNGNTGFGVYVSHAGATLNLNNAMVQSNQSSGIQVEGGTVSIAGSTIASNTVHGIVGLDIYLATIDIKNTIITSNANDGINTTGVNVTVSDSSSITENGGGSPTYYQIEAGNGAAVTVASSTLKGTIVVSGGGGTITVDGTPFHRDDSGPAWTCDVTLGVGSCSE